MGHPGGMRWLDALSGLPQAVASGGNDEGAGREKSRAVTFSASKATPRAVSALSPERCRIAEEFHPPGDGDQPHPPGAAWDSTLKWNMGWMHDMLDYFELVSWDASVPPEQQSVSRLRITTPENFIAGPSATMKWWHARAICLNKMARR